MVKEFIKIRSFDNKEKNTTNLFAKCNFKKRSRKDYTYSTNRQRDQTKGIDMDRVYSSYGYRCQPGPQKGNAAEDDLEKHDGEQLAKKEER